MTRWICRLCRAVAAALAPHLRDTCGLAGGASIAWGCGMIYLPAGLIAGGAMLLAGAILTAQPTR